MTNNCTSRERVHLYIGRHVTDKLHVRNSVWCYACLMGIRGRLRLSLSLLPGQKYCMAERPSWDICGVLQGLFSHSEKLAVKARGADEQPRTFMVWPSLDLLTLDIWISYHPCFWRALSAQGCVHSQGLVTKPQTNSGLCRGLRDGRGWQPHCFHILPGWLWGIWDGEQCWGIGGACYQGWEYKQCKNHGGYREGRVRARQDQRMGWDSCDMLCDTLLMLTRWLSLYLSGRWWWQVLLISWLTWGGETFPSASLFWLPPSTTIHVLKAIAINGDCNSYESLVCQWIS